jgi:FkbM family methyltransferase
LTPNQIETIARLNFVDGEPAARAAFEVFAKATHDLSSAAPNMFRLNGEAWLIEHTARFGFRTIFDVGANIGEWAGHAYKYHPGATIHCFEILPSTYDLLAERIGARRDRCVLNRFGLAERDGEVEVFHDSNPLISSIYDFSSDDAKHRAMCKVRRGDDYARDNGIAQIDLLKIDVEGAEATVIKGFEGLLQQRAIRIVQFEYNRGAIVSHFLLKDFYDLFARWDYVLGRLGPEGVTFRDYHWAHEDFNGPNYVACRRDDRAIQAAITVSAGARGAPREAVAASGDGP